MLTLAGAGVAGVAAVGGVTDYAAGGVVRRAASKIGGTKASTALPRAFTVNTTSASASAGDLFLSNMGTSAPAALIADPSGETVWSATGQKSYADTRLQSYHGSPVITWWESPTTGLAAYGSGRDVVTGTDHQVITTIGSHDGVSPDEHEFFLTDHGTAYIVSYVEVERDLSDYGGATKQPVLNGVFEEIDLATGAVLHHWESLDHVDLAESHAGIPTDPAEPWDYFHINSAKPTPDGDVLISARHVWAVYKVGLDTGAVRWRLGGKRSDFHVPTAATFAWQHDAEFEDATTVRLFDNGTDGTVTVSKESQILWLKLDERRRQATLVRRFTHPDQVSALAMGNAQRLDNGNVMVGWGTAKRISEFDPYGELVFDATLPEMSYRAYRATWR